MTDEKRREMIQEARMLSIASPVILPMIKERKRISFEILMSKFRSGEKDLLTQIADLAALDALERDIISRDQTFKQLEEKHNGR